MNAKLFLVSVLTALVVIMLSACGPQYHDGVPSCSYGGGLFGIGTKWVADGEQHPDQLSWICDASKGVFVKANGNSSNQDPAEPTPATAIGSGPTTPEPAKTAASTPTKGPDFELKLNTLGQKPANGENVDPKVYVQPYTAGTITDAQGNGVWTQSGKNGSAQLLGVIPEGNYVEIDAYTIWKDGKEFTKGNIIVVAGPLDLTNAKLSYKDGGANLIKGDLQAFLDDNVWGKFCRGNLIVDPSTKQPVLDANGDLQFKYQPWALTNIQLPEGFTFKSLTECAKKRAEDTTSYPKP